ncbi:MAG: DUF1566 domain-containing protein [Treponema sp.]|nr:DUF1566 domain-containing protein [Treponema sp.]
MKKAMFVAILHFLAGIIYAQTLDTSINAAAGELSGKLPKGSTVVMIEFETASEELANHVIDEMNHKLVTLGIIRAVERRRLNTIRSELSLNSRGEVSDDFAQRIGHMLGAQHLVLGSISSAGNQYIVRFRAISTETATIVWSFSQNIRSDTILENFLSKGGTTTASNRAGQTTQATAAPAAKIYEIGSTGPAGGHVFYDKGYYADGWRYLEAATSDVGSGIPWSATEKRVDGTSTAIGIGKRNSELIRESGETISAALAALHYSQGGYNDWFLPSRDELNFIYVNLKQKNLGKFSAGWYWSSSDYGSGGWYQRFSNGEQSDRNKKETFLVRPVRAF